MRDRRRLARVAAALFALQVSVGVPLASAAASTPPGLRARTKSYIFMLTLGMPEHIWTPAQAKMMHPKTGELVLNGPMNQAMPMGATQRELEVHISTRATGDTVAGASPTITVTDASVQNHSTVTVTAVDELEGVHAGADDLHYGNNIDLVGGDTYTVVVTLNGQRAVLRASAPRS